MQTETWIYINDQKIRASYFCRLHYNLNRMLIDPNNNVVRLCAQGMDQEGKGNPEDAGKLFLLAWAEATNDFEKFIAAHYVARHQHSVADKLKWDKTALQSALQLNDDHIKGMFPSLYLNIAKYYEDLCDFENARNNYQLANSFQNYLPHSEYGNFIKEGIIAGLHRVK